MGVFVEVQRHEGSPESRELAPPKRTDPLRSVKGADEWRSTLERALNQVDVKNAEMIRQYFRTVDEAKRLKQRLLQDHPDFLEPRDGLSRLFQTDEPVYAFQIQPDGGLWVNVRRNDVEVTIRLNHPEDLKEKFPKLFDRYRRLEASEIGNESN